MNNVFLNLAIVLFFSAQGLSQKTVFSSQAAIPKPNPVIDCQCNNNVLKDGGFETVLVNTPHTDIIAASPIWKPNTQTPQWSIVESPCNKGALSMWGNKTVFESVIQSVTIPNGTYTVKVTARAINTATSPKPVRLKVTAGSGSAVSANFGTAWQTHTFCLTTTGSSTVILQPENDETVNDGAFVSWIQVDNVCIEKGCQIPDEKCNPKFSLAPFTLNSHCNVVVEATPVVTAGATHYWGLMLATGISDNTPVPLANIIGGGTFGLSVSSTGVATPIGMGTGINAGGSHYGYHYEGVALGACFKITHYIKCCNKWYAQTNTYCTKLCSDVKESAVIEVPAPR
jgi:hypothetical protein